MKGTERNPLASRLHIPCISLLLCYSPLPHFSALSVPSLPSYFWSILRGFCTGDLEVTSLTAKIMCHRGAMVVSAPWTLCNWSLERRICGCRTEGDDGGTACLWKRKLHLTAGPWVKLWNQLLPCLFHVVAAPQCWVSFTEWIYYSGVLNAGKWSNPDPWLESKEGVCFKLAISRVFFLWVGNIKVCKSHK